MNADQVNLNRQVTLFLTNPGYEYFCLKIGKSRQQQHRYEQRFDKLFEATEIFCRFIDEPQDGKFIKQVKLTAAVKLLDAEGLSEFERLMASVDPIVFMERLNEVVLPYLLNELETEGYSQKACSHIKAHHLQMCKSLQEYKATYGRDAIASGTSLYLYVSTLRNSRFHAYAGTSGYIIGHQRLLGPICDLFERILLLLAQARFNVDAQILEGAIARF